MTKQISFKDIRKGDRIRARHTPDYGVTRTFEGVAHEFAFGNAWYTEEGGLIVNEPTVESITLLERPAPAEPKELGAVVRAVEGLEYISVNRQPGTPRWVNAGLHKGSNRWALKWADLYHDGIEVIA